MTIWATSHLPHAMPGLHPSLVRRYFPVGHTTTVILQYFVVHTGLWSRVSPCFGLVTKLCFCYCEDQENKNFAVVIYHSITAV